MAKYDVRVRYTFEGTYKVVAEDRDEAEKNSNGRLRSGIGRQYHTTRDDDEVTDWRFDSHPDMQILSFRERVDKGKVRYTSMCFSDRIEELRKDIIEAIRNHDAYRTERNLIYRQQRRPGIGSSGSGKTVNHTSAG